MSNKRNIRRIVSEPKRHHINPQVLLREFADRDGRVKVVPKDGGAPRLQHVSNVSVIRHANTMQTDAGRDYSLERVLSQIEGHFPEALSLLDLSSRKAEQDATILALVVTQAARDPWTRRGFLGGEIEQDYEALRYALRADLPRISDAEVESEVDYYGRNNFVQAHVLPNSR
jgi:hypothetical protein